jgi:hypothetical protein
MEKKNDFVESKFYRNTQEESKTEKRSKQLPKDETKYRIHGGK